MYTWLPVWLSKADLLSFDGHGCSCLLPQQPQSILRSARRWHTYFSCHRLAAPCDWFHEPSAITGAHRSELLTHAKALAFRFVLQIILVLPVAVHHMQLHFCFWDRNILWNFWLFRVFDDGSHFLLLSYSTCHSPMSQSPLPTPPAASESPPVLFGRARNGLPPAAPHIRPLPTLGSQPLFRAAPGFTLTLLQWVATPSVLSATALERGPVPVGRCQQASLLLWMLQRAAMAVPSVRRD